MDDGARDHGSRDGLEDWLLRSWQSDGAVLPAFPIIATRLVDALEQPEAQLDLVQEIIAQDGSITTEVIRVANSALYGGASPVADLRRAVMRLGFRETSNLAMAAACRSLFTLEDRAEREVFPDLWGSLWGSALVCAYAARMLASELKLGDPARVFLAAMFRDVGSLLILKLVASGLVNGRLRTAPTEAEMEQLFATLHTRLGASYLRRSHMPDDVVEAAERHHEAEIPFAHDTIGIHIVRCADGLCDQLGIVPFSSAEMGAAGERSAELLGVDSSRLEYFGLQIESLREQLRDWI